MAIFPKSYPPVRYARCLSGRGGRHGGKDDLRLWRGWTTPENADGYEELIRATIFPGILARTFAGLEGLELSAVRSKLRSSS